MTKKPVISFWGVSVFAGILGTLPICATAAELSVYAPGGVRSAVQVAAGAPADVAVLPSKGISQLEKDGLVAPNSRLEVGSVGVGVGIKAGTPRPKIGTLEDFRATLLAAKSITYADPAHGATSGTYFATVVLPHLGIVEQMQGKTVLTAVGEDAVRRVANGKSEIVAVPGAELVGPLPASIQNAIAYAAMVLKSSKIPDVAQAFVTFMDSPFGRMAFQAAGFQRTGTR